MSFPGLAALAVGVGLAVLLSGCGASSQAPSSPLPSSPLPSSPLAVTTSTLPQGVVSTSYNVTLNASGGVMPYAWNVASGSLPAGVTMSRAGVLSGTPMATGSSSFTVALTDSAHPPGVANGNFTITIAPPLQVSTTSLLSSSPSVFYSATLAANGGLPAYTWSITQGSLPSGLILNASSGLISGIPSGAGTSTFTVQASDSEAPAMQATARLSIAVNLPPARNGALYIDAPNASASPQLDQTGLQIRSDGSLTLLSSSPETAVTGTLFAPSPTLPLLFLIDSRGGSPPLGSVNKLESLLINPDYSLTSYSSASLQSGNFSYPRPAVDPSGSNLYVPGPIDSSGTIGLNIFLADGSMQSLGTIDMTSVSSLSGMVFTPDGALAFVSTCSPSKQGSILSYSRAANGILTPVATYNAASCAVVGPMTVSPDGKYLATTEVQIYTIAGNGTLNAVLSQPFTVVLDSQGYPTAVGDISWAASSSYLLVSIEQTLPNGILPSGGVGVLTFSGSALNETTFPMGGTGVNRIQQAGSFVYGMGGGCFVTCVNSILGFSFQNGQLTPLSGSPFSYGNISGDMVIY